jgi:hypothetical protein
VNAAKADRAGFFAELGDGGGETLGVQAGGIPQGAVLVDPLAPVGHDQGNQPTRASDHPERLRSSRGTCSWLRPPWRCGAPIGRTAPVAVFIRCITQHPPKADSPVSHQHTPTHPHDAASQNPRRQKPSDYPLNVYL